MVSIVSIDSIDSIEFYEVIFGQYQIDWVEEEKPLGARASEWNPLVPITLLAMQGQPNLVTR